MFTLWQAIQPVLIITMVTMKGVVCETDAPLNLTIRCPETDDGENCVYIKPATEYRLELNCQVADAHEVASIQWLHHNGTDINAIGSPRMHYDATATSALLTITDLHLEDSGNYSCVTSLPAFGAVIEVDAYVMPDYFTAGMILLGVNLALVVLFVACLANSIVKQRKQMKRHTGYKNQTQFQKLDTEKEIV